MDNDYLQGLTMRSKSLARVPTSLESDTSAEHILGGLR
jgi:hypothetical protein